jgi:hypothetical protein
MDFDKEFYGLSNNNQSFEVFQQQWSKWSNNRSDSVYLEDDFENNTFAKKPKDLIETEIKEMIQETKDDPKDEASSDGNPSDKKADAGKV